MAYKAQKHTTTDMYEHFKQKYPYTEVTFAMFRHVLSQFNKKAVEDILDGETLKMGHGLGHLRIRKIERKFGGKAKKAVDWGETNKLRAQGENIMVYFTNDEWFRWYWTKKFCNVPNKSVYRFDPTKGLHGAAAKLAKRLNEDEFASITYKP